MKDAGTARAAKIFRNGNSLAVRIPKEFCAEGEELLRICWTQIFAFISSRGDKEGWPEMNLWMKDRQG
jgi:hypothetical protein